MPANLLGLETSPYLLQHKDNPVHWMPWGDAAFSRARAEDRPILLSIGYAACHWCHVMAHESFEDEMTAGIMNAGFINVKVDREERPDVDRIYMDALHALGEQGGWPLTMFIAPDGLPFWGGTYFPPESRYGRPSFNHVLNEISRIWNHERHKVESNGSALRQALQARPKPAEPNELTLDTIAHAATLVAGAVDPQLGGLKGAPKFPQSPLFSFLWESAARNAQPQVWNAVTTTLTRMSQGGIFDHLGGGLSRYSVDARWLAPHFEKMLYDNAQYVDLLTRAWVATQDPLFRQRIDENIAFVIGSMTTAAGAFASSYDADSEGEEGRFYVWSKSEIDSLLGDSAPTFRQVYDVTAQGNWEGHTILNRLAHLDLLDPETESTLAACRQKLLGARARRVPPGYDDKVLTDWNGLMIEALANAALALQRKDWLAAAVHAFDRIVTLLWDGDSLHHAWRAGQIRGHATADDYANFIAAALALHAAGGDPSYLDWAGRLAKSMADTHWDDEGGGYYFASSRTTDLIIHPKSGHDDATPNANGTMLRNLARLAHLTGKQTYHEQAEAILRAYSAQALSNPFACPSILRGALMLLDPIQVILTGEQTHGGWSPLLSRFIALNRPEAIVGHIADASLLPEDHPARMKTASYDPRLYICRGHTCAAPCQTPDDVDAALKLLGLTAA